VFRELKELIILFHRLCEMLEHTGLIIDFMHTEFLNKIIISASSEIRVGRVVFLIKVFLGLHIVVSQV
jgi:hypothetical protein